ncbi:hypothetical protein PSTG_14244 [Puccinia striiformis f. sp. tritici PST-78]|uniref:HAT C-terminal dimerisation domain-containing protein n=1 Tax=Puccinia striiformis f. sp. tritici PST-78 TaxID=1165861 RepID=A0A0L0V003_9BASI|nr:hypothetical protein PSTG_14244 [Puccinia striiformis f. sp. tritici PST-78]
MANKSKKRRKSSPPLRSSEPSDVSGNEPEATDIDSTTPGNTQPPKSQERTDEQELKRARNKHLSSASACYAHFDPPQLGDHLDKHGRKMIAYPRKTCGTHIHRPTYDSSPTNLSKHVASCQLKKQLDSKESQKLAAIGVSGTGDIDPREVPQLCVIWCAETARPFSALGEDAHRCILHLTVVKHLPTQKAVSRDIGMLYTAVQQDLITSLKNHEGAMYLGLDAWQWPNGYDILGTVIYRLVQEEAGGFKLEAMPLDFVWLKESHTGLYLADTIWVIVEKFGVQHKICGIVTDNASNNQTMIEEIKKFKWARFKGDTQWVRCFAHILNLIAQVILRPFGSHKKKKNTTADSDNVSDNSNSDEDDPDHQIIMSNEDGLSSDQEDEENDPINNDSDLAAELIGDEELELETDDINDLSDEGENDVYTSKSCKQTLGKFRAIARKLNKSPNSKGLFVDICREKNCLKPHTVERDERTRWNSTLVQLTSIRRCSKAILEWQKDKRCGTSRSYHINQNNLDLARDLVNILELFYEITLIVLTRGGAQISEVVVFIDQITGHVSTVISDQRDVYPAALRNACRAGLQLTNKYYTLTDCSPLYRVAMILHPSFKDEYFKLARWEPEWIAESIRLAREMWEHQYKPQVQQTTKSNPRLKPQTGVLAGLSGASEARTGNMATDPLTMWLTGGLALDNEGQLVNPLKWWIKQGRAGNTHGGLLQMALDVLSCPATTVDVEQSFNFGRDYVSVRRHRLSALSLTQGMTVAFYSKNGQISSGVLRRWKIDIKKNKKSNKGKEKEIICEVDSS